MKKILSIGVVAAIALYTVSASCTDEPKPDKGETTGSVAAPPAAIQFTVVNKFPFDTSYFTEGLEFYKGQLLASSGGNNESSPYPSEFGMVDRATGKVTPKAKLDKAKYFGEGITVFNDKIYMLTWTSGVGFVYDANTFKLIKEFKIPAPQGWGLTHDSASLIMSDGSSNLYFLDPETLQVKNTLTVTHNSSPLNNINELEYVNGVIYANRWMENVILKIDATTGNVLGQMDMDSLDQQAKATYPGALEMNGIAYDHATGKLFVTGKKWPTLFEIKLL
ncbi:glutaminyl-peptide cyclotransferase [Paraflavitalea pollutisoli]|uniref:glutaminyl-peptide cyclotransferase n=1 Tax=Paraflavitalea pollutisoli TaxID=3034143 RepID=UPI0023ED08C3|nr:glutaminyl-peptide cyclotransferase [Paraflavitalea sp. H1-2-19X]